MISSSFVGCPAPSSAAVVALARSFGAGVCFVRPSSRSFSGWVCVVAVRGSAAAAAVAAAAAARFFGSGCFCAVRPGLRAGCFRVSVPCLSPALRVGRRFGAVRLCGAAGLRRRRLLVPVSVSPVSPVGSVLSRFQSFGLSGSRAPLPALVPVVQSVLASLPASASVFVGCAAGVDAVVRSSFPGASVVSVSSGQFGSGRSAFARRSAAVVSAVASAAGLWVSFPSGACPAGVVPCRSWRSAGGSGSWGSLALAAGLGLPCLVFLPSCQPPAWGFSSLGGGWWFRAGAAQLSLL